MMNTINEIKMNGKKLKLVTPFEFIEDVDHNGIITYSVIYNTEDGEIVAVPFHIINALRNFSLSERSRHDQLNHSIRNTAKDLNYVELVEDDANRLQDKIKQVFTGAQYDLRRNDRGGVDDYREDYEPPRYTNPARTLSYSLKPDPHLDKQLLTRDELQEVLLWALEVSNQTGWPDIKDPINTSPDSALSKIAAFLATLVYGDNNYIGPNKTGDIGVVTLEEAVTTVPALSEADARARAHDIGLSVTNSPAVDAILPPLGAAAQVFRPIFNVVGDDIVMTKQAPPKYSVAPKNKEGLIQSRSAGMTNKSLLKLAGDVEENPGPPKKYSTEAAEQERQLYTDPRLYNSRFNVIARTLPDYRRTYYNSGNQVYMRGLRDDQTDAYYPDDGITQFTGWSFESVPTIGNQVTYFPAKLFNYGVIADTPKTKTLELGALGSALNATLSTFPDLLALQRTSTNTIDGNVELNIFTRTPKTDFGCFLPIVKLLLNEMYFAPLSGDWALDWIDNVMVKRSDLLVPPSAWFPNTINEAAGGPLSNIRAFAVNSSVLGALILGNVAPGNLPPNWPGLNDPETAYVILSDELDPRVVTHITLAHLEWPTSDGTNRAFTDSMTLPAFRRTTNGIGHPWYSDINLINGPKGNVVYILASQSDNNEVVLEDGVNPPVVIPVWDDITVVGPGAVLIQNTLQAFDARLMQQDRTAFSDTFNAALDYFLRFADIDDWVAALSLTGTIINTIGHFQRARWNGLVNQSGYWATVVAQPVVAPQVNNFITWDQTPGNTAGVVNSWRAWYPVWNDRGMTARGVAQPAPGVVREPGQIDAWVQDTPWLTKYGIYKKYFAKNTLDPKMIDEYVKFGLGPLFYTILDGTRHRAQMLHNLIQNKGIVNRDLFIGGPQVLGRRQSLWNEIDKVVVGYDKILAKWSFFRPTLRTFLAAEPVPPVNIVNLTGTSYAWFFDSPVYLANPYLEMDEAEAGIYPLSSTGVLGVKFCPKWEPNASNQITVYGTNFGGGQSMSVVPGHGKNGGHDDAGRRLFAMVKQTHMGNPAVNNALLNYVLLRENSNNRNPQFDRPVIFGSWTAYLRWVTDTEDQQTPFANSRQLLISMPFYPRGVDLVTGQQLVIIATNAAVPNSIAGSIDMKGAGSSTYVTFDLPGQDAYDISSEYGSLFGKAPEAPDEEPPPKN